MFKFWDFKRILRYNLGDSISYILKIMEIIKVEKQVNVYQIFENNEKVNLRK